MFTVRNMSEALEWLFNLYDHEDFLDWEEVDREDFYPLNCFPIPMLCNAMRDNAVRVYQYRLTGKYDDSFDYRGKELFDQRAVKLYSTLKPRGHSHHGIFYLHELWMLEDGTFALVNCVQMIGLDSCDHYCTEYRALEKFVSAMEDLSMTPADLREKFDSLCVGQCEKGATVYEL